MANRQNSHSIRAAKHSSKKGNAPTGKLKKDTAEERQREREDLARGRELDPKIDLSKLDIDSSGRVIERQTPGRRER